ncbi:GntR family transcriptional regulator [Hyphomicrobium denitrificans 1NES1]|uniref:GntR family transcriptional regulator n=1 Tax=Hyphomicrobium denitrificans 1NES1 TaxID=670307 RepID=N0B6V5_9HYPH|nr:FCD domain-containing protein [Hyphomicrobium denitrificans]AGK56276.1 GntR family transcriptional regulator [Hyphomicrobium denitrificans 1NES1]
MAGVISKVIPPWEQEGVDPPFAKEKVKLAARRIFDRIVTGEYSFGSRLAAERNFADEFGMTRSTVRQALEFLEAYGVVVRRANSGTYVVYKAAPAHSAPAQPPPSLDYLDIKAIVESASPFEMGVVCSLLEPEIVRLGALYMSVRDLNELRILLEDIETVVADAAKFAHLEKQFLMKIAEGTHNRLLITMYRIVGEVRCQPHWLATRIQSLSPQRISDSRQRLRSLFEALENRDIEGAMEFMNLIIASNQQDLLYQP